VLRIRDNGKGITEGQIYAPTSLGLMGMRERVRSWQGDIAFEGASGKGTSLTVRIPRVDIEESQND
jgi:two-component system sensor histidine kinase UhpB